MEKKIIRLFLLSFFVVSLIGCATYNVNMVRGSQQFTATEVFSNSKQEIFDTVKTAFEEVGLILRKSDFEKGMLLATPNRWKSFGKRLGGSLIGGPMGATSYVGIYVYITEQKDKFNKVEIVQVYDNPMNVGMEYKTILMNRLKEKLTIKKNV